MYEWNPTLFTFFSCSCCSSSSSILVVEISSKVVELGLQEASVDERLELFGVGRLEHFLVGEKRVEYVALLGVEEAPQLVDVVLVGLVVVHARLRVVLAHDARGRLLDAQRRLARLVQVLERHVAQLFDIFS